MFTRHNHILLILALLISTSISSAQEKTRLAWPPPPQDPRIEYLYAISNVSDIGIEKSFISKIWDWVTGADDQINFLVKPMDVFVDDRNLLYVTDPGARCVHIFDRENKEHEILREAEDGELHSPVAIAVSADGHIYVTDSERREVVVYNEDRDVTFTIRGLFVRPTGISILRNRLYVVDTALNKVFVFTLDGDLLFEFGNRGIGKGEFNYPVFLASSTNLYIVDAMNHRIQVLTDSGNPLKTFGSAGDVQGTFANPKGIAISRQGHIYVTDALFDAFQVFDSTGNLLLVVGRAGSGDGEFWLPSGIWIDPNDTIYVVDALNRRIQLFQYLPKKSK